MSVEQGLRIGVHEWDHNSNYERMIFYELAEKFKEFEVAEKLLHPKFQLIRGLPGCPTPAPPRPEPPRPPMPAVVQQPVCVPRQTDSKTQAACPPTPKCQQPPETKAPDEIPPEAVREYIDIMDWLEEHHLLSMPVSKENQEEEQQQEEEEIVPDLDISSYCDELCSQDDFLTKVEAIINPQFLDAVESPDADLDIILATRQVLEEEHELTVDQLVEKRLLGSKEKGGVCRPQSRGAPQSAAHQGAERDDPDRKRRRNKETCSPPNASQVLKRHRATDEEQPGPEVPAVLHRRHSRAPLGASGPSALPQDLAPRGTVALRAASLIEGPASCPDEDDEDFSSLSFLLASPRQLLPWQWPQTPDPDTGLLCPGDPAPQPSTPQGGSHSPDLPPSARSKKQVLTGGSAPVGKAFCPGPSCEVSAGQDLAQGQIPPQWPKKRRGNKGGSQRRRKRH
ncbi:NUT family member 2G isoform X1 [Fukomys damarensis]|uniref:Protein FAM22B n=1 Tax=Fukomys damarensis TaxID=885580 RepID=A0A091CNL7_FUKDA|nr:NUT family member 2G isoform X1 [Fukomys damarensis]KFO20559.1 Protein FAM22B [Fukomys damarensis]